MGNKQYSLRPLRPDAQKLEAHFIAGQSIKRRERLVHQQDIGIEQQGARDRHALLHAAGQLIDALRCKVGQTDEREQIARPRLVGGADASVLVAQRKGHVAEHVEPRQQSRPLKHDADFVARLGDCQVVDTDRAAGRKYQAGDQPQQCRFAATGRPKDCEKFVTSDIERHVLKRGHRRSVVASERLLDTGETDDVRKLVHRRASRRRRVVRHLSPLKEGTTDRLPSRDRSYQAAGFAPRLSISRSLPAGPWRRHLHRLSC